MVMHAAVVTLDEEDPFGTSKVIGYCNPPTLKRVVFFCVRKAFCLRGGENSIV